MNFNFRSIYKSRSKYSASQSFVLDDVLYYIWCLVNFAETIDRFILRYLTAWWDLVHHGWPLGLKSVLGEAFSQTEPMTSVCKRSARGSQKPCKVLSRTWSLDEPEGFSISTSLHDQLFDPWSLRTVLSTMHPFCHKSQDMNSTVLLHLDHIWQRRCKSAG